MTNRNIGTWQGTGQHLPVRALANQNAIPARLLSDDALLAAYWAAVEDTDALVRELVRS